MLDTLLLSSDRQLVSTLKSISADLGMVPTVCSEPSDAIAMLARRKFYGAFIDGPDAEMVTQILNAIRISVSSRNAISVVVSDGSTVGGTFVLRRPVTADSAMRTLRTAKALMLNEFRRYFRHPMQKPVVITKDPGGESQATSINVSHGGIAVQMANVNAIARKDTVRARIVLPGCVNSIETKGTVAWIDARGRAGIRCENISARDRQQLEQWLAHNLPQK